MTAISRSKTKIWIVSADTDPTALSYSATSDVAATDNGYFSGDIKSYSKSGGENDVESDPVFGGFVDKEKPTSQFEISMEIVPLTDAGISDRWDYMAYGSEVVGANTIYTSAQSGTDTTQPADRMVVIEADDGTNQKTLMYNNCNVTVLDLEHNADDNRTYNLSLKLSPTDGNGVANFATANLAASLMPAFSDLDNN